MVTSTDVNNVALQIIRRTYNPIVAAAIADSINTGSTTMAAFKAQLIANGADKCTQPALIVSNYIEGVVPASATVTSRAGFCQNQYDYYVAIGSANAALGPYEALGAAFGPEASFAAKIAGRSLSQVIDDAYLHAFLTTPSPAAAANLAGQYSSFYSSYVGAGMSATDADKKAKGAVVGQILGYAGTTSGNTLNSKAVTWLNAAGNFTETYGSAL